MKKLLPFLTLPLFCLSSCSFNNDNSLDNAKVVEVTLKKGEASNDVINPFIYGTFIEHIETCIYNGLWAEIIKDRKFYKPVNEDVSQWIKVNGDIQMDSMNPFEGEYSLILKKNDKVRQNGLSLKENETYVGYINVKGNGKLKISFEADSKVNEIILDINCLEFNKKTYEFTSIFTSNKTKLSFECLEGSLTLDSVSLMNKDNYYGMRKDTLDKLKELNSPFYRWPGGNFVSGYDFYDGIGDRDLRPTKRNLNYCGLESDFSSEEERISNDLIKIGYLGFYGAFDSNDFGIDEFILMCRYLNAEPNIVVNSGLGNKEMAKDEVEYCNSTSGKMALLRQNKEPYNVKCFSVGNEMNGSWQLGHVPINEYVKRHNEFVQAMKSVDPSMKIIAVGDNASSWSQNMINGCKDNIDYLSEHFYATRKEENVKDHILSLKEQGTYRIQKHRDLVNRGNITMSIDEYAYDLAENPSRLKDGMGVASLLNEFIKNSDVVDIACYSSTINATQGNVITDNFNAYLEASGYALSLYRDNMQNHYLPLSYKGGKNDDYYEVFGTINDERNEISISVINTLNEKLLLTCNDFKEIISKDYVLGDYLESINNSSRQELNRFKETKGLKNVVVDPLSISVFKIKI